MMMQMIRFFLLVVLFFSGYAVAQGGFDLSELDKGQALLHLTASESEKVEQDLLIASLRYSVEGTDAVALQNQVNIAMKRVMTVAKDVKEVEYSTEQYSVYMSGRSKGNQPQKWQAQQNFKIESKDAVALLELAGKLQEAGLQMNYLNYSLSPEKYEEVSDGLMKGALQKLQARADEAAKVLGKSSASLIDITLNGSNSFARAPRMMAMSEGVVSSAKMEPPTAEPSQTQVSLTVSAKALLKP